MGYFKAIKLISSLNRVSYFSFFIYILLTPPIWCALMITLLFSHPVFALKDDLQKTVEIAAHGSKFQAERLKIVAENLANEYSTSSIPGGEPYRRKIIFAKNRNDKKLKTNVISVKKFSVDKKSPFILKYDPNHPAADLNGYVKYPNISKVVERADSIEAQRSYEANLSIIEMSKSMMQKTLEVIR